METNTQIMSVDPQGLAENKATEIKNFFVPMLEKMESLTERATEIKALEISDETCAAAKKLRLEFVKVRTGTAKIHRELKSEFWAGGRVVDGWKNTQLAAGEKVERELKEIEDHFQLIEKKRIAELQKQREILLGNNTDMPSTPGLGAMPEEVWRNLYAGAKLGRQSRLEAEQKAKSEAEEAEKKARKARIEAAREAKEEADRVFRENARLKKEAEEAEIGRAHV